MWHPRALADVNSLSNNDPDCWLTNVCQVKLILHNSYGTMRLSLIASLACVACEARKRYASTAAYREHLLALLQRNKAPDPMFDCAWRNYAFHYANQVQPWLSGDQLQLLYGALQIAQSNCTSETTQRLLHEPRPARALPVHAVSVQASFYVDPVNGSDSNSGSIASPLRTVPAAVAASRASRPAGQGSVAIILRAGTHYIASTITLSQADSGLAFSAYPGEHPVVSGAVPVLGLVWTPSTVVPSGWSTLFNNTNTVYGQCGTPAVPNKGVMPNWQACQSSCLSDPTCTGWTYNGDGFGSFTHVCCWRTDGAWTPVAENGTISQYKQVGYTIWNTTWPKTAPTTAPALLVNGRRATLARFPNADIETDLFPAGYIMDAAWLPPAPGGDTKPVADYTYTYVFPPEQTDPARGIYINYTTGYGGLAARYTPPRSFWASSDFGPQSWQPTSVDDRWMEMHLRSPSGLNYGASLPRAPYADLSQAVIRTWRAAHWYSWMFGGLAQLNSTSFTFSTGGHQGGEGHDEAAEWYVEGVREELDEPGEFYLDTRAGVFYFSPRAQDATGPDGAPPATLEMPQVSILFHLQGSQEFPVVNVSFSGLTVTGGPPTFMEPRGVPSGGDWALERMGMILLEGTEGVSISDCNFTRIDGNAIFLAAYNRGAVIARNSFEWLGQNAIASWGEATEYDGTSGDQPRHTTVYGNIAHDLGLHQKQSSFYFQAVSCENSISDNIVFDIPRAAINFDDGFGGGNAVTGNLLFNTCQESSDHSAMNSWDRMPYLTLVRDGVTPSVIPADNDVRANFVVDNMAADGGCWDTDDGSSWYLFRYNFCVFGGHKSDFDGHSKRSVNNLHVYPSVYGPRCLQIGAQRLPMAGYPDVYVNNTCILASADDHVVALDVPGDDWPNAASFPSQLLLANNTVYAPGGTPGYEGPGGYKTYAAFQAAGYDTSTVIRADVPDASTIISWAAALLAEGRQVRAGK